MSETEIKDVPVVNPKIKIDKATRKKLLSKVAEESQVIMHCSFNGGEFGSLVRVWKTVYLFAKDSKHKSKLVIVDNIALAPNWMHVDSNETAYFTLIFEGLPKNCKQFDLIENAPTKRGFLVKNIPRNGSDIYLIDVTHRRVLS